MSTPMHEFVLLQALRMLQMDPAYEDSGFPTTPDVDESLSGAAHEALAPGPAYRISAHYWNPSLHTGGAPMAAGLHYEVLARAVELRRDPSERAQEAVLLAHHVTDALDPDRADAITVVGDDLDALVRIARDFDATASDAPCDATGAVSRVAILRATEQLEASVPFDQREHLAAWWARVDARLGGEPARCRSIAAFLHDLADHETERPPAYFYSTFDPFLYAPATPRPAPTEPVLLATPAANYRVADWNPGVDFWHPSGVRRSDARRDAIEVLVDRSALAAQADPEGGSAIAVQAVLTAFRASITGIRIGSATWGYDDLAGRSRVRATIHNAADATLHLRWAVVWRFEGGWRFDVGAQRLEGDLASGATREVAFTLAGDPTRDGPYTFDVIGDYGDLPDAGRATAVLAFRDDAPPARVSVAQAWVATVAFVLGTALTVAGAVLMALGSLRRVDASREAGY